MEAYRDPPAPSPFVVTAFGRMVVALEAATGKELWRAQVGNDYSDRGVRLHVTAEEVVALGIGELCVFRLATGEKLRTVALDGSAARSQTLLVVGRRAYVSMSGVLVAIDLDRGEVLWKNELPGTGYGSAALGVPGLVVQGDVAR